MPRRSPHDFSEPQAAPPHPAPIWVDPWAFIVIAAVLPLLARASGASLAEPFADDFDFLRHAWLAPWSWLDGGGAAIYWRPLSRQGYYAVLGPWLMRAPALIVGLHCALLVATSLLLYRSLRARWPGPWSASVASFLLLTEASRAFLLWPTTFQDLGALLFSALAIHAATRRRLVGATLSVAAALLCKETAVVTALLVPWIPGLGDRRARQRWNAVMLATIAIWGAVYAAILHRGAVMFASQLEAAWPPWPQRFGWALQLGLRDGLGLGALPGWEAWGLASGFALVLGGVALRSLLDAAARARLAAASQWIGWGLAWFFLQSALLAQVFPLWGPFRSVFGMLGLGLALVAATWAAAPRLVAALVGLRLIALLASIGPPTLIEDVPTGQAASYDFESLARLSRLTHETRAVLVSSHPTLPPAATVVWSHRPTMAQHAFARGEALQVWYRDTTLRWIGWEQAQNDTTRQPDVVLEFEPDQQPQVMALAPGAASAYLDAVQDLAANVTDRALARLALADSLQHDRRARVFLAAIAGKRALAELGRDDLAGARAAAESSLRLWRDGNDARYVLATLAIVDGRLPEAHAQLDSLLARYPFDLSGRELLDTVEARQRSR